MSEITVPPSAFVPCPAIGFKNRRASKCLDCAHFAGLVDSQPKHPNAEFEHKYRMGCSHPIARRTVTIEVEDAGAQ